MTHVKIKDDQVMKFPYDFTDLMTDNPYTSYDTRFDVMGWFNQTDDALKHGYSLHPVEEQEFPHEVDQSIKNISLSTTPVLENDVWVLKWIITDKTPEEIEQFQLAAEQAMNSATTIQQ